MTNIHFCWFGSAVPLDILARLDRWKKLHPCWTIRQWNESNIDVSECAYAQACLHRRDWAYLSDYVRLQALTKEGGVYLDTDVELLKPLDGYIDASFHIGYMHNCALGTAVMISPANHPILGRLIAQNQNLPRNRGINNNAILTEFFLKHVQGFRLTGESWSSPNIRVHPKTWFEQPTLNQAGGFAIHLFNRAWDPKAVHPAQRATTQRKILFFLNCRNLKTSRSLRWMVNHWNCQQMIFRSVRCA